MSAERLGPLAPAGLTEEQRKAAEEFQQGRGYAAHGPFAVMLRSPEVMLRAKAMGDYLRFRNVLPKRVSEMVILITAREWTQQFEWTYHYRHATEAGLAREIADGGVSEWGCRQLAYGNEEPPGLEANPADPFDSMNPFPPSSVRPFARATSRRSPTRFSCATSNPISTSWTGHGAGKSAGVRSCST